MKAALAGWFADQGFITVECGAVQISPGNETHLHGFPVQWRPEGGSEQTLYLHTSPEFAAKKLEWRRHSLESAEREIAWLEKMIKTERKSS